jgi:hypothetical protein
LTVFALHIAGTLHTFAGRRLTFPGFADLILLAGHTFAGVCDTLSIVTNLISLTGDLSAGVGLATTVHTFFVCCTFGTATGFDAGASAAEFIRLTGHIFAGIADVVFIDLSITVVVFLVTDLLLRLSGCSITLKSASVGFAGLFSLRFAFPFACFTRFSKVSKVFVSLTITVVVLAVTNLFFRGKGFG